MNKLFFILLSIVYSVSINGQSFVGNEKNYIDNALMNAGKVFIEMDEYNHHAVFTVNVISLSKNTGEFAISYILNDYDYSQVNPSYYFKIRDRLFLVRTNYLTPLFTTHSLCQEISSEVKVEAKSILAGPNCTISANPPRLTVVKYKKKRIEYINYRYDWEAHDKYNYWIDDNGSK